MFARRENDKPLHLGLTPHCGLCGTAMRVGQACTVLLGVDKATRLDRCMAPFAYPKYCFFHGEWNLGRDGKTGKNSGNGEDSDDVPMLCRDPGCSKGTASLEACTVHVDCCVLFARMAGTADKETAAGDGGGGAGDRMWIAAAWQRPWRQAAWLWLDEPVDRRVAIDQVVAAAGSEDDEDDKDGDGSDGEEMGLRQILHGMQRLPTELVQMIHDMSSKSLLWRLSSVLGRYHDTTADTDKHTTLLLTGIEAWERGSLCPASKTSPGAPEKPVIRLTMDNRGLRTIERLAARPSSVQRRIVHNEAYSVVDASDVQGVTVHFRFGLARLELPRRIRGLHVWDTPTPPLLDDCNLVLSRLMPTTRFQAIPLDRVDGITLMFVHSKLEAVHVHTPATPAARTTILSLDETDISWVYVPIAPGDRVLAVGVRRCGKEVRDADIDLANMSDENDGDSGEEKEEESIDYRNAYREYSMGFLQFRFGKAGDVYIGPMMKEPREDTVLAAAPPITLLVSTIETFILSVMGAYSGSSTPVPRPLPALDPPFGDHQSRPIVTADDHMSYISTAPLDGIVRIRVFQDPVRGFDRGLLLFYENGGQRALGQCRVGGVDDVTDYDRPACLCITRDGYKHVKKNPAPREPASQTWYVFYAQGSDALEHTHDDEDEDEDDARSIWECMPLNQLGCGRLQVTFTSRSSKLEVIEDDEAMKVWRKDRLNASMSSFHRPRKARS
ncbi:hypothetical protein SCUCBS95973_009477 [Sporothrix curviconia]|uniref:F-box domain containing protein n=1 Tax=Sporothrix curviconia TaxID=1260050 RepID=A0ABP0CYF8_9PEZI